MTDSEIRTAARTVAGRYQLVRELGRGGMGRVWLADDQLTGRQVAVKELRADHGLSEADRDVFARRALSEARSAARIQHTCAVTLYDVLPATAADSAVYLIMEYLNGPNLARLIDTSGPQPAASVAAWALQLLSVLETAHSLGIIHRDIKPANIILSDGQVRLTDFGIAHHVGDPRLTSNGIMGTQAYMAPELFTTGDLTPAADLWSLGATLHAAAAGRDPFGRDTPAAILNAVLAAPLPAAPGPPELAAAIAGLLERDPARRATIAQAREQFRRAADLTRPAAPPRTELPPAEPPRAQPLHGVLPPAAPPHSGPPQPLRGVLPPGAPPHSGPPQPLRGVLPPAAPPHSGPSAAAGPLAGGLPGSAGPPGEQPLFAWKAEWKGLARGLMLAEAWKAIADGQQLTVLVFSWGIQLAAGPGGASVRWPDITQLWRDIAQQPGQVRYRYRLTVATGFEQVIGGALGLNADQWSRAQPLSARPGITAQVSIEQLGRLLDEGLTRAHLPLARSTYRAGQPAVFGRVTVSQHGIASGGHVLPWAELQAVEARGDAVCFMTAGAWWPWLGMLVSQIPNYPVFEALVREILDKQPPAPGR